MHEKETVKDVIKRIHGAASNPTLDSVGTSDVLVLNRNGIATCYYIDKDKLVLLSHFIRSIVILRRTLFWIPMAG